MSPDGPAPTINLQETGTVRAAHSRIDRYLTHRCGILQACPDHPWCAMYLNMLLKPVC